MKKMYIAIKKYLIVKPKWRILRIYTKVIPRTKLEDLKIALEKLLSIEKNEIERAFLKGKIEIINQILK